jgi:ribonuclease BN (tRNA processing enzyme)
MRLTVLGCGDAFGSGGRFNTCFQLDSGDTRVLVDCGASAMISMRRFNVDPDSVDAVVLSHLHGDHFGGLPFLLLYLHFEVGRTRPLVIAGPPETETQVQAACTALFGSIRCDWGFPLEFVTLEPGRRSTVAGLAVDSFEVFHGDGVTARALRLGDGEKVFAFSGDTTWVDVLPTVAEGADLFVVECYAFDRDLATHCSYKTLEAHLPELAARRVMLSHMSQGMLARLDEARIEALSDGRVIDL